MDPALPRVVLDGARLRPHSDVPLDGEQERYLRTVLRLAEGDAVLVLDGAGGVFHGQVAATGLHIAAAGDPAEASLAGTAPCRVEILQALPKGDRFADIVRQATELGAWRFVPVITARTIRRPPAGGTQKAERWRRIAREAARQSRRLWVPEVDAPRSLEEALEAARGAVKIVLHEGERARRLRDVLAVPAPDRSVSLAVGPEGGFSDAEVALCEARGFAVAGLGPRVLRTETVALAACAVLQHVWGDLG